MDFGIDPSALQVQGVLVLAAVVFCTQMTAELLRRGWSGFPDEAKPLLALVYAVLFLSLPLVLPPAWVEVAMQSVAVAAGAGYMKRFMRNA